MVAAPRHRHYIEGAGLRGARANIPGALSILKGAVPGRARGSGHMAPTYFRREPGIDGSNGQAAPHSSHSSIVPPSRVTHCRKARAR